MLGTRLKSWMEAHIVRARKKQNKKGKNDKTVALTSQQDEPSDSKTGVASMRKDSSEYSVGDGGGSRPSMTADGTQKGSASDKSKGHLPSDTSKIHLSSPESAYSTGYSTDGTSPGASIPPEYYINLRTGKHYVQASTGNTGVSGAETVVPRGGGVGLSVVPRPVGVALPPQPPTSPRPAPNLTPCSARRRREEALKRKKAEGTLPESSTEEDVAKPPSQNTPKSQRKPNHAVLSHRRTESYDESSQRYRVQIPVYSVIDRDSEGSSSTRTTGGSSSVHSNTSANNNTNTNIANNNNNNYGRPNCTSPFLSSAAASPRQRNRIRTNPWVGVGPPGSAPLAAPEDPTAPKNYSSQGETSSTVGSSSTLSSAGRVDVSGVAPAPLSGSSSPRLCIPPPPGDLLRLVRSGTYVASPLVNGRRSGVDPVTTCSPQPNRPCRHTRGRDHKNSTLSLSSSSTPSSEEDALLLNSASKNGAARQRSMTQRVAGSSPSPSDDLSEDDLTLNEMGKYDESYVYEKETDILSDSDPTDCDDPNHYHSDHSSAISADCSNQTGNKEEIDFIDTGSIAELDESRGHGFGSGKIINRGHCTYVGSFGTPEASVKMKRRSRGRRQKSDDRSSSASANGPSLSRNLSECSHKSRSGSATSTPTRRCRRRRSARATPVIYDDDSQQQGSPISARSSLRGRSPNLNRLLVDRLMTGGGRTPLTATEAPVASRSADCTPVSLRKHCSNHHHHHRHHHHHELNGKVLKNPHVSKLISSSNCPSPSMEPKLIRPTPVDQYSPVLVKRRSNSLSVSGSPHAYFNIPAPPHAPPSAPSRALDNDDSKYRRLIREAENLLTVEQRAEMRHRSKTPPSAFSPFHKTGYSPRNLGKPVPTPTLPPPPPYSPYDIEIESAINNNMLASPSVHPKTKTVPRNPSGAEEGNFLKTISKTLEKIMIRKEKKPKNTLPSENSPRNHPNDITSSPSPLTYRTLGGANNFHDEEGYIAVTIQSKNYDAVNHNNEEPLYANNGVKDHPMHSLRIVDRDNNDNVFPGPTFTTFGRDNRNATPIKEIPNPSDGICPQPRKPKKLGLTLWKEGQLSAPRDKVSRKDEAVSTPKTPLIPFEAFDLVGRPRPEDVEAPLLTSPLPQSEPVKRKVYACSSTFDRLQKSLMLRGDHDPEPVGMFMERKFHSGNGSHVFQDGEDLPTLSTEALRDENMSLKEKVEQLRRRRMEVEERVRNTQAQIDRLRAADVTNQRQLASTNPFSLP